MCRPIKAHAFFVSAETQGPNSTNITEDHRLFLQKEKEELTVRSKLLWDIPMRGGCAQTHTVPKIQIKPNTFPQWCPTSLAPCPSPLGHKTLKTNSTKELDPVVSLDADSPRTVKALSRATIGSLLCSSHSSSRVSFLPKMLSLRSGSYFPLHHLLPPALLFDCHLAFLLPLPYSIL